MVENKKGVKCNPSFIKIFCSSIEKKLKYLKINKIPRLLKMLRIKNNFELFLFDLKTAKPYM
jgi:hypothetical protein